jgi:Rab3 GTPase-activating protein catalytic subunit
MLNCCIERKQSREARHGKPSSNNKVKHRRISASSDVTEGGDDSESQHKSQSKGDSSFSSEEEFYECLESAEEGTSAEPSEMVTSPESDQPESMETDSGSTQKAEGRLKPCGDMKLINVNEFLFIPVTQEPAPMTEDMLEEHAEVLAK